MEGATQRNKQLLEENGGLDGGKVKTAFYLDVCCFRHLLFFVFFFLRAPTLCNIPTGNNPSMLKAGIKEAIFP